MLVDIIQRFHNRADFRRGGCRYRLIMLQEASDNDIDISLFDEFRRVFRKKIQRIEVGTETFIKLFVE